MDIFKKSKKRILMDQWLEDATWHDAGSEEATRARENIVGLMNAKKSKIDPNVIISGVVSLTGVVVVCFSDKTQLIGQKAFQLVLKTFKH